MSIGKAGLVYGACLIVFLGIDAIWLGTMNARLYQPMLGHLMAERPKLGVAAGFYLVYVLGLLVLAVLPGLREGTAIAALWRGALVGLLAYGTYDLTNMATLRDWPLQVTVVDMVWGTVLTGVVSLAGYYVGRLLGV